MRNDIDHDEVILRYEGGEEIPDIVRDLKSRDIKASQYLVEKILDQHAIPRHPKRRGVAMAKPGNAEWLAEVMRLYRNGDLTHIQATMELRVRGFKVPDVSALTGVTRKNGRWSEPAPRPPLALVLATGLTDKDLKKLAERFLAGETMAELAKEIRVHSTQLSQGLKKGGYLQNTDYRRTRR